MKHILLVGLLVATLVLAAASEKNDAKFQIIEQERADCAGWDEECTHRVCCDDCKVCRCNGFGTNCRCNESRSSCDKK
nr:venom gland protein U3-PHTX-Pmx1a [Physocyclus mexicanus]